MTKFLAGVVVGAVAGLLLAPEKGSEMREHIAETAEKWKEKWDRLMGNAGIELEDLKHVLEQEINGLSDDVRNRILTILEEGKNTAANIRNEVKSEVRTNI